MVKANALIYQGRTGKIFFMINNKVTELSPYQITELGGIEDLRPFVRDLNINEYKKIEEKTLTEDLKDIAVSFDGWDGLRKAITKIEQDQIEANYDDYMSDYGADGPAEVAHRQREAQKLK